MHAQAIELAREPDGEIGDVDHLLHLAMPFRPELAHLQRDQVSQRLLHLAQRLPEIAHQLAALGGGDFPPTEEGSLGGLRHPLIGRGRGLDHFCDRLPGGGVVGGQLAALGIADPGLRAVAGPGVHRLELQLGEERLHRHDSLSLDRGGRNWSQSSGRRVVSVAQRVVRPASSAERLRV